MIKLVESPCTCNQEVKVYGYYNYCVYVYFD